MASMLTVKACSVYSPPIDSSSLPGAPIVAAVVYLVVGRLGAGAVARPPPVLLAIGPPPGMVEEEEVVLEGDLLCP